MHGKGNVMVNAPYITIAVPAIGNVEFIEFGQIAFCQAAVVLYAKAFKGDVNENAEEFPVIVGIIELPGIKEIVDEIVSRPCIERVPHFLRHKGERKTKCGKLYHALIPALDGAPVLGMRRIRAIGDTLRITVPVVESAATGAERRKTPKWPCKAFQIGRSAVEMPGGSIKTHARIPC